MKLLNLLIDHEVLRAEIQLEDATAENVLERAKVYFALLCAFRRQLETFAGMSVMREPGPARFAATTKDRPVEPDRYGDRGGRERDHTGRPVDRLVHDHQRLGGGPDIQSRRLPRLQRMGSRGERSAHHHRDGTDPGRERRQGGGIAATEGVRSVSTTRRGDALSHWPSISARSRPLPKYYISTAASGVTLECA
jgi:hypothetical protein